MTEQGAVALAAAPADDEEVRTLFISGLPNDIKEREIYNLFRTYAGYESCQLKYTGRGYQIVAFAVFNNQMSALAAKAGLNGHKIDPDIGSTLHIELAKSNSRGKRPHSDEQNTVEKKFRSSSGMDGIYSDSGLVHSVYDLHGYPPSQSAMIGGYVVSDGVQGFMMGSGMPPPPLRGSNAPCSTLFVANLGSTCSEHEVTQTFSRYPGFRMVKMQSRGGLPVAFVEFQDTGCSTQALNQLQNIMLPSSVQGGIRIEYAKVRMGQPGRERSQLQV